MIKRILFSLSVIVLLAQNSLAADKKAKCEISINNKVVFNSICIFSPEQGGSFSLSNVKQEQPLLDDVAVLSVAVIAKGVAEVRGLTTEGVNSRWGEAKRSHKDKACWAGADFKICAR